MEMFKELVDLVEELKANKEVVGVAIFGSYARGEARPNSDIDVLVLIKKGVRRDIEKRGNRNFEFVYASFAEALKFYKENPNDCVQLWQDAVILYDKVDALHKLRTFAQKLRKKGRAPVSENKRKHAQFDAEDAVSAIKALSLTDISTASLYAHIKAANLIELYFDIRQLWTPPPKKQLKTIRDINKKDAVIFDAFFSATDLQTQIKQLPKMIKATFSA